VQLDYDLEDVANVQDVVGSDVELKNAVVVHPGKGWKTKTFPIDWWQGVIDGFLKNGELVIIIGKDMGENQGTVEIDASGCIDARNLLNIGALLALIAKCKVVVTNDSSPVHIAAAFDTNTILIPSCKHPDFVLPYRSNGDKYLNVNVFYDRLFVELYEADPSQVYDIEVDDYYSDEFMREVLPDVNKIIDCVKNLN